MASTPTTTPANLPPLKSSKLSRKDSTEQRSRGLCISEQDKTAAALDTPTVTAHDKLSPGADDIIKAEPVGTKSQNGEASCQIIMSGDSGVEIGESMSSESASVDGTCVTTEALSSVNSDSVSSLQVLNPKTRLVRCQAVCDDASPSPPPPSLSTDPNKPASVVIKESLEGDMSAEIVRSSPNVSQVDSTDTANRDHGSSYGSAMSDGGGPSSGPSRDSAVDSTYTDSTGTNLEDFIIKTLNKNTTDRAVMLHLEADMVAFINDTGKEKWKFPPMTSYLRMLVHRVAAFFGLDHNVDEHGKCVVISRLPNTRIPDFKFQDHLHDDHLLDDQPKKSILKRQRDCTSLEEILGIERIALDERRSKSFEERSEEYMEARSRIFREMPAENNGLCSSVGENGEDARETASGKNGANWSTEGHPWRSSESSGYGSFQVTVLSRDSQASSSSCCEQLSKADPVVCAVENASTCATSLPAAISKSSPDGEAGGDGPLAGSPFLPFTDDHGEPLAIWVASTISQIPPGSIIINPRKGEPYTNPDGSMYRWYPPMHLLAKKECSTREGLTPDKEVEAVVKDQPSSTTQQLTNQSQVADKASTSGASTTTLTSAAAVTKSQRVNRPQVVKTNSTSVSFSSAAVGQMPPSALPAPFPGKPQPAPGVIVPSRHRAPPPPTMPPVYNGGATSVPGSVPPVRFLGPQTLGYSPASSTLDLQAHTPDVSHYGYAPAYPAESFQVNSLPPVAVPHLPVDQYHHHQQPVTVVHYADKTWNQYGQPVTLLPGPQGSVAGQMYYAMEPSSLATAQSGIPAQAHQYPVQLVVVSSATSTDLTPSQPSMMTGGVLVPGNAHAAYFGSGGGVAAPPSDAQPVYFQYAYQPSQPLGGGAVPVMPLFPNMLTMAVPPASSGASFRGPAPCLVPAAYPPLPAGSRPPSHLSPSPKTLQFSVPPPPPPHSNAHVRLPYVDLSVQPREPIPHLARTVVGTAGTRPSNQPAFGARQSRFSSGRQNNVAFPQAVHTMPGNPRYPRPAHPRMATPSFPSNFHQKQQLGAASARTSSISASSDVPKLSTVPQPCVGVTAESEDRSLVLEVCGVPPTTSRQKLGAYLADLAALGAKEFQVQDDPKAAPAPRDGGCVGSSTVMAIFDSATSAQRALRDHRGDRYRLQSATRFYPIHRS